MLQYVHSAQFARTARTRQACYWFGLTALVKRHCDSVQWSSDYNLPAQASLCVKAVQTKVWNRLVIHPWCVHVRSSSIIDPTGFQNLILCREMQLCESGIHKVKASISRTQKGGILSSRLHLRFRFSTNPLGLRVVCIIQMMARRCHVISWLFFPPLLPKITWPIALFKNRLLNNWNNDSDSLLSPDWHGHTRLRSI